MTMRNGDLLFRKALGQVISDYRYDNAITLRQMSASGSGRISTTYLWELENAKKEASSEMLVEVAECMGISTSELVVRAGLVMGGGVPDTPEEILDNYLGTMIVSK